MAEQSNPQVRGALPGRQTSLILTQQGYRCAVCEQVVSFHDLRRCSDCDSRKFCYKICSDDECKTRACTKHATCWETHLIPYKVAVGRGKHQPISPLPEVFVDIVTHSEPDEKRQKQLHQLDQAANWFNVVYREIETGGVKPFLQITDRVRQLCNPGMLSNEVISSQYPGFVSFIGDTSAGKSTLVKAMLLMAHLDYTGDNFDAITSDDQREKETIEQLERHASASGQYPVTRTSNIDQLIDPTSLGVSLYKDIPPPHDPKAKSNRLTPILFADCEGFRGGTATTSTERSRHTDRWYATSNRTSSASRDRFQSPSSSYDTNQSSRGAPRATHDQTRKCLIIHFWERNHG